MKKFIILGFLLLLIFIGFGGLYWWNKSTAPVSSSESPISFVITKGSSASLVGNKLVKSGIIRSALAFKIYTQITGKSGKVFPGEYTLYPNRDLFEVTAELLKGPKEIWVTIPEGLRHEEIALKFANGLGKTGTGYQEFVTEFIALTKGSEGYLFPSTYLFPKDVTAQKVVNKLTQTFEEEFAMVSGAPAGFSKKEVVTLASLIERETKGVEEKPVVAGIIVKRFEAGWPLQIDASVQYAVGTSKLRTGDISGIKFWETLTKDDLEIDSAYNVYKFKGLPPGPICNPGLASLKAAGSPKESTYWFYIHDDKGQIHYAVTQEEHTANVRKYLGK
jgi:UPF0755 protein